MLLHVPKPLCRCRFSQTHYCQGHRLNSPNDLAFSKRGDLYFTDPPYGLPLRHEDPEFQAHGFGGVYLVRKEAIEAARAAEGGVGCASKTAAAPEPELVESGAYLA